ncbi:hypothetical protein FRC03_003123 [Tulasnella sp. 419]|nr:hypothetical protein FRC03_003123 [Tulasnella sp. 419]
MWGSLETKTKKGLAPLMTAMDFYHQIRRGDITTSIARMMRQGDSFRCNDDEFEIAQLRKIIIFLIEHHADPFLNGSTLLLYAAISEDWDLVELLLLHGADPTSLVHARLESARPPLWLRFQFAVNMHYKPGNPRPFRLCPCHSRLSLDECHNSPEAKATLIPYPLYFLCPCDSGKTFENCCDKRGINWGELWAEESSLMDVGCRHRIQMPLKGWEDDNKTDQYVRLHEQAKLEEDNEDPAITKTRYLILQSVVLPYILRCLVEQGNVDPAFEAVLKSTMKCPPIAAIRLPKNDIQSRTGKWNAAVDSYISHYQGPRSVVVIERAAKIRIDGDPLFRPCSSKSCTKYETPNEMFKRCSGCKSSG